MTTSPSLTDAMRAAWARRAELHADPELDVYRLFHGWAEGCPGLDIDRLGEVATIELRPEAAGRLDEAVGALDACRRFDTLVVRPRREPPRLLRGALPAGPLLVREHGLRFAVEPARAASTGLFLDARPARAWIRANARGRRLLNLFAFTGSLGVAGAAGGAREVVHVDSVQRALDACRANHALNGIPIDDRSLARINVYQHLRRQQAGRQRFDAIVVDPPPLAPIAHKTDRTPGARGVLALAPRLAAMLAPGGWLLAFFHHDEPDGNVPREEAVAAAAGLAIRWRGESGLDFPAGGGRHKLRFAAFG